MFHQLCRDYYNEYHRYYYYYLYCNNEASKIGNHTCVCVCLLAVLCFSFSEAKAFASMYRVCGTMPCTRAVGVQDEVLHGSSANAGRSLARLCNKDGDNNFLLLLSL